MAYIITQMKHKIEEQSPLRNIKLRAGSFDRYKEKETETTQVDCRLFTEQDAAPSSSGRKLRPPPLDLSSVGSRPSQKMRESMPTVL